MKILITGANGFVGRRLVSLLQEQGHQLLLAMRSEIHSSVATIVIGDIRRPANDISFVLNTL